MQTTDIATNQVQKRYFADQATPHATNHRSPVVTQQININTKAYRINDQYVALVMTNRGHHSLSPKGISVMYQDQTISIDHQRIFKDQAKVFWLPLAIPEVTSPETQEPALQIFDYYGALISSRNIESIEHWSRETTLRVSEIFANPAGSDTDREWFETFCHTERCNADDYLFMINQKTESLKDTTQKSIPQVCIAAA